MQAEHHPNDPEEARNELAASVLAMSDLERREILQEIDAALKRISADPKKPPASHHTE